MKTIWGMLLVTAFTVTLLAGCALKVKKPERICKGQPDVLSAIARLSSDASHLTEIKASGDGTYEQTDANGRQGPESLRLLLFMAPPQNIYVQFDVSLAKRAVVIGSNDSEFWLAIKPKDISKYYWGRWEENGLSTRTCIEKLLPGSQIWLEAMGIFRFDANDVQNWKLSNESAYDILTKYDPNGVILKRIHIYNCDHRVRKIEYFDQEGNVTGVARLDKYELVNGSDQWFIPHELEINVTTEQGLRQNVFLRISEAATKTFSQKERTLFVRPSSRSFNDVLKLSPNCEFERD